MQTKKYMNMFPFSEFMGSTAEWTQPDTFERFFELRSADSLLETLSFRSSCGTLATAEALDEKWTFKRVGFLNPRVTVRVAGLEADMSVYQPKFWGDGLLSIENGPLIMWKPTNFWATDWAFIDQVDNIVMGFKGGIEQERLRDIFKIQTTLEIDRTMIYREHIPMLASLGMYLIILHHQDASAAAASAGAAAS